MRIKIVIPKFHAAFNEAPVRMFLRDVGDKVKQIMVQQAAAPKTGRVYLLRGGTYQASAPGEFPANKFGHLSRSYRFEVEAREMKVGTDVLVYPAYLRAGTQKMAPRKFLRQALGDAMEMERMKRPFAEWRKG
jgi:hypothetical protein